MGSLKKKIMNSTCATDIELEFLENKVTNANDNYEEQGELTLNNSRAGRIYDEEKGSKDDVLEEQEELRLIFSQGGSLGDEGKEIEEDHDNDDEEEEISEEEDTFWNGSFIQFWKEKLSLLNPFSPEVSRPKKREIF